ncbi:MAG TPA: enoyl-CoA hydratase-related protein [Anaerolineales bacterium]
MTNAGEQFITSHIQDGILHVSLNRPPVNVLHIPMLQELESILDSMAQDEAVRVLVLQAQGKLFSAGVDIADHTADKVGEMIPLVDRVCSHLAGFPVPTIARVHGHALGGGCEMVLCCDLAVMAEEASLGQPEIQLAAVAPVAALRLPYLVGYRAAADMLFSGRRFTATEAQQVGLVNAVVAAGELDGWVREKAESLSALSRAALVLAKRALLLGFSKWTQAMPEMERLYLEDLMNTADAHEGLRAFMDKRPPQWQHK